uniref:C2H2-type domain-containing protein n=1 Tax=Fagus sylvatica TaxID=28930 RepID=A0A2N9F3C8_FAGSY
MEFRYRAIDDRGSSATHVPPPPPSSSSSTTHPLPYASNALTQTLDSTSNPLSLTLNNELALAQRRLLLKAEMRREIMLEEMSMMTAAAPPLLRPEYGAVELYGGDSANESESSPTQPIMQPLSNDGKETLVLILPLPRPSQPMKPKDGKETIFLPLTRPRPLPLVDDTILVVRKERMEWSCNLCQVKTTSQQGLEDHLNGKKHKAKKAFLNASKTLKEEEESNDDEEEQHKAKAAFLISSKTLEQEESDDGEEKKGKAALLNGHRNGKKHMNLLRKKGGSIIAISTRPEDVQEVETIAAKT